MAKTKEIPAVAAEEREPFPRDWSDIRGHAAVIARLRHLAADGRLPHALMLTGTEGVGKRRTARVLARTLLCTAGGDAPCGHCDSCRTMAAGVHPDYFEVSPEARGKSAAMIRADAVRDILIDDVHCMNEVAANRLLKTLEEPPATVLFLLVTSAWDAVLPTIRSRAVRIAFGTVPRAEIAAELHGRGIEAAETIAALADGSIGRAERLAAEGLSLRDDALAFLTSLSALRVEELWTRAEELGARPYEERSAWLGYLQMALRDLLVLREDAGAELYHGDRRADLTSLLPAMPRTRVLALMEEAGTLLRRFGANVNPALQAEAFFLRARQAAQD